MLNKIIKYFLDNRVIALLLLVTVIGWGLSTAPFNWHGGLLPKDPIPVDAICKAVAEARHDTDRHTAEQSVYDALPACCKYRG